MLTPLKDHFLNGWVATSSSAAPPSVAFRKLIHTVGFVPLSVIKG